MIAPRFLEELYPYGAFTTTFKTGPLADHRCLAEGPVAVLLDGDTRAIPLMEDLKRAGFTLRNDEHGATWLRRIDEPQMARISDGIVPADFSKAMLDFLRGMRLDVDQARCVSVCAEGAPRHENTAETEDMAQALSGVNETLWEQAK